MLSRPPQPSHPAAVLVAPFVTHHTAPGRHCSCPVNGACSGGIKRRYFGKEPCSKLLSHLAQAGPSTGHCFTNCGAFPRLRNNPVLKYFWYSLCTKNTKIKSVDLVLEHLVKIFSAWTPCYTCAGRIAAPSSSKNQDNLFRTLGLI